MKSPDEQSKTEEERANDIAYTVNHALSCGMTDVALQPMIAAAFGINVGCNHSDHDHHGHDHHDHAHHHHDHPPKAKLTLKSFASEAGHYFKGEIIGDFVAVPLTIAVQRLFPNFMHGLRNLLEPLFGWAFRLGANHTAHIWAKKQGLASDAPEVVAHADAIYEHEMSHLPQAAMWNMFAYPIGAVAQKIGGHGSSYAHIFKSKLVGAAVSNGLLIGGRMMAPGTAEQWDQFTGDKLFLPVTKTVGKLFGIDEKAMEKTTGRQKPESSWEARVRNDEMPTAMADTPRR